VDNFVVKMMAFWDTVYHASEEFLSLCMITHSVETIFSSCQRLSICQQSCFCVFHVTKWVCLPNLGHFSPKFGYGGVSFVFYGSSLLWTPTLRTYSGSLRLPMERKGIGRCV